MPALPDQLVVFARAPAPGQVKTRLARVIGDAVALRAYRELLAGTLHAAHGCENVDRWLYGTGEDPAQALPALASVHRMRLAVQCEGDLGVRMADALRRALSVGVRAVLVGCDCPLIDSRLLARAFAALHTRDFVFGPTEDGGYALVGARLDRPAVFQGIDWGTERVMMQTRERLREAGVSVCELPTMWDVDEAADWHRYLAWRARGRDADAGSHP